MEVHRLYQSMDILIISKSSTMDGLDYINLRTKENPHSHTMCATLFNLQKGKKVKEL